MTMKIIIRDLTNIKIEANQRISTLINKKQLKMTIPKNKNTQNEIILL